MADPRDRLDGPTADWANGLDPIASLALARGSSCEKGAQPVCFSRISMPSEAIQCKPLEVVVSDRGIERAIKMLKRKLASEGVLRELKMRRHYMKPSVKRRKKQAEAARRRRKRAKLDAAPPKS